MKVIILKKKKFSNFVEKYNNKEDPIEKLFQFVEVSAGYNNLYSFLNLFTCGIRFSSKLCEEYLFNKFIK